MDPIPDLLKGHGDLVKLANLRELAATSSGAALAKVQISITAIEPKLGQYDKEKLAKLSWWRAQLQGKKTRTFLKQLNYTPKPYLTADPPFKLDKLTDYIVPVLFDRVVAPEWMLMVYLVLGVASYYGANVALKWWHNYKFEKKEQRQLELSQDDPFRYTAMGTYGTTGKSAAALEKIKAYEQRGVCMDSHRRKYNLPERGC